MIELNGKNTNKEYIELKEEIKPNKTNTYSEMNSQRKYQV
jgi:hypothetical protein